MKEINILKAQPIVDNEPVKSVVIVIDDEIKSHSTLNDMRETFNAEADMLFAALESLPGGTFDALLCKMMQEKASLFIVPMFEDENENTIH